MKKIAIVIVCIFLASFTYVSIKYFSSSYASTQQNNKMWSNHKISEYFPSPKIDNIVKETYNIDKKVTYEMNWSKDDAIEYIKLCRKNGFVSHVAEKTIDGVTTWSAKTKDKLYEVTITYSDNNEGTLTLWQIK